MPARQDTEITTFTQADAEWYTPLWLAQASRWVLRSIDLDPASTEEANKVIKASKYMTKEINGLSLPWGTASHPVTVFLNPPSQRGSKTARVPLWTAKLREEYLKRRVSAAILVVKGNLGYNWYEELYRSQWVCHLTKLPKFWRPGGVTQGKAKKGVSVFYFGPHTKRFIRILKPYGKIVPPDRFLDSMLDSVL